jgi:hypothetical protein
VRCAVRSAGWAPSCKCKNNPVPSKLLDPFAGSRYHRVSLRYVTAELRCSSDAPASQLGVILGDPASGSCVF